MTGWRPHVRILGICDLYIDRLAPRQECDILVSKLLGFETFANFWRVLVPEKFGLGKKSRFRFLRIKSRKTSLGFGFDKFGHGK